MAISSPQKKSWYPRFVRKSESGSFKIVLNPFSDISTAERKVNRKKQKMLERADEACEKGLFDKAIKIYRDYMSFDPESTEIFKLIALAYGRKSDEELKSGKKELALKSARTALDLDHDSSAFRSKVVRCLVELEDFAEAESLLLSGKTERSAAFHAYHEMGQAHERNQQVDKALTCYRNALEARPQARALQFKVGSMLLERNKFNEAVAAFSECVRLDAQDPAAQNRLAYSYTQLGRYSEAEKHFLSASHLEPQSEETFLNLGRSYAKRRMYEQASDSFRKAVDINPANHSSLVILAKALVLAKKYREAVDVMDECLKRDSGDVEISVLKGDVLLRMRKYEAAMETYRSVNAGVQRSEVLRKIAGLHLLNGNVEKAKESFTEAAVVETDDALKSMSMGYAHLLVGDVAAARDSFSEAISKNPRCDEAYVGLSKSLLESDLVVEAHQAVRVVVLRSPFFVEALLQLADVRVRMNDPLVAIMCYERVIRIDDTHEKALVQCGALMCAHGQMENGVRLLSRALELNPDAKDAQCQLALAFAGAGNDVESSKHLEDLFANYPDDTPMFVNLALDLEVRNLQGKAMEVLQRTVLLNPGCHEAIQHIDRMATMKDVEGLIETPQQNSNRSASMYSKQRRALLNSV